MDVTQARCRASVLLGSRDVQLSSKVYEVADIGAVQELYHSNGWTDGLPIVPPTRDAVQACLDWAMTAAGSTDRHRAGARHGGDGGETRGQRSDGRLPADAFPRRGYRDDRDAATKNSCCTAQPRAPAAVRCSSCSTDRSGWKSVRRAASTRWAIRSRHRRDRPRDPAGLINILDVRPGGIDRSTLGHPGKFSYCVAEDEEDTTWLPLAEQRGMPPGASAVTVMAAGAPRQIMNEWTTRAARKSWKPSPPRCAPTCGTTRSACRQLRASIIPKQLREHMQAAGWSKTDIAAFIHERARIHRREWAEVGKGAVVRDRGDSDLSGAGIAGPSAGRRRRRSGRRLRRGHPAVARPQEPGGDDGDRRLCRLRTAEG